MREKAVCLSWPVAPACLSCMPLGVSCRTLRAGRTEVFSEQRSTQVRTAQGAKEGVVFFSVHAAQPILASSCSPASPHNPLDLIHTKTEIKLGSYLEDIMGGLCCKIRERISRVIVGRYI